MRSEREVNEAIERYADTVRRICMLHLKNQADTQDLFQTVFWKYALSGQRFESDAHEKAWLIRVTLNACRDLIRNVFRRRTVSLDAALNRPAPVPEEHREVLQAVLDLPVRYREVIYLHYYEGYTAAEIGRILGRSENTVYAQMSRARQMLKSVLGGEERA